MKSIGILIILILGFFGMIEASDFDAMYKEVAEFRKLDPEYLKLIAVLESGEKPYAINHDKKPYYFDTRKEAEDFLAMIPAHQSVDIGLMQIQSQWFRKIGIAPEEGLDPEVSLKIAAILIKDIFERHGESQNNLKWYHSGRKSIQENYIRRIQDVVHNGKHRIN